MFHSYCVSYVNVIFVLFGCLVSVRMLRECVAYVCVWCAMAQVDEQPYCSVRYERLCQGKGPHVACQFPYRGPGEACENYTAIIFSNDLKQFVLHYVNRRRQKIASGHERVRGGVHLPKPELMMMVQWDRELAFLAQRLADQCQFVHDDCRATVRYPYAGQTVGEVRWRRSGSLEKGARRVIGRVFDAWWGERRRVQAKQLISPFVLTARGAVWGHFSQLAVWTLRAMGCGAVHHGSARPRLLLVCDFSHTNMLGQRTISPGSMAPCPQHTTRPQQSPYPLLCAPVRHLQAGEEYRRLDSDDEDEQDNYDDDDDIIDDTEIDRRPYSTDPDEDTTKPWPNRPVRPILDIAAETDQPASYPRQDEFEDINAPRHRHGEAVDKESQYSRRRDDEAVSPDNYNFRNRPAETGSQFFINRHAEPVARDRPTIRDDDTVNSFIHRHGDRIEMDRQTHGHYNTAAREQPMRPTIETNTPRIRPVYELVESNKRPIRPLDELVQRKPVGSLRHDAMAVQPLQDEIADSERPIRPIELETAKKPDRRVKPLIKDVDDDVLDRTIRWRAETVTTALYHHHHHDNERVTKVIVRYRGDGSEGVKEILDNELNQKGREFALLNRQQAARHRESEMRHIQRERTEQERTREPELRNKAAHKINNYRKFETRRKGEYKISKDLEMGQRMLTHWRDEREREDLNQGVLPLERQTKLPSGSDITTVVVYRPTSLFSIATEPVYRSRFKQTRERPNRPGANALLQTTPLAFVRRQTKKASFLLDKDDEEQLYHDTGFKLSTIR